MQKIPKRSEIWLVSWYPGRGSEQVGYRPSLIVQDNEGNFNNKYNNTIILAITTQKKNQPLHIELPKGVSGLKKDSYIKCEQMLTISKDRLIKKLGSVNRDVMFEVECGILSVLGMDP